MDNLAVAYENAIASSTDSPEPIPGQVSDLNGSPAKKNYIVEARNLTVAYRSYKERATSLKESIVRLIKHGQFRYYSTFDALSDVSFTVERGTVYGLIGSNGSGKSTLLKVLAGVLTPTGGSIEVNGSVASLIDIGIGFDPELNAIENIYLNGSLYRRTRNQIRDRVDHIIEFAELNEFATTPVKYYSAGMFARLGFSVAIDINPDILLVDEVLAVGDERFQSKCREVFRNFLETKKTIIIVSHDMRMLEETASRIGVLSCGKLVFDGDPAEAVRVYRDSHYQTRLGHAE